MFSGSRMQHWKGTPSKQKNRRAFTIKRSVALISKVVRVYTYRWVCLAYCFDDVFHFMMFLYVLISHRMNGWNPTRLGKGAIVGRRYSKNFRVREPLTISLRVFLIIALVKSGNYTVRWSCTTQPWLVAVQSKHKGRMQIDSM